MKIREQTIKELEGLHPAELHLVYDLIQSLKGKAVRRACGEARESYKKVREALITCKGSMSDDIFRPGR
jgi:hypothetical protein